MENTKICTGCKNEKSYSCFYKSKQVKDGYAFRCKECVKMNERTKEGVCKRFYYTQVSSSKNREHALPSYTSEELTEWVLKQELFHELHEQWVKSNYDRWLKPSIDRKNDYLPYTFDNIQLMTWRQNNLKSHADRKNGINNKQNRPVYQYDLGGVFVKEYYSVHQAGRELGVAASEIKDVCKGRRHTVRKFVFSYNKEDNTEEIMTKIRKTKNSNSYPRVVLQFNGDELIAEYPAIVVAAKKTGISRTNINNSLKGWSKTAGGFSWKYKNII